MTRKTKKTPYSKKPKFPLSERRIQHYRDLVKKNNRMYYRLKTYIGRRSLRVDKFRDIETFNKAVKQLERRTRMGTTAYRYYRDSVFKENYIYHVRRKFGSLLEGTNVIERLQNANPTDFYKFYKTNSLDYIYQFKYNETSDGNIEDLERLINELNLAPKIFGKAM